MREGEGHGRDLRLGAGTKRAGQAPPTLSPAPAEASSTGRPGKLVRWALHRWFRFTRGMTMGVRIAVLDADGRVFLVRHTYVSGWHLPGGGIEGGQTVREAVDTELREEGNITLTEEPELVGVYLNRSAAPRDHVVFFVARAFMQHAPKRPDREIAEAGFFPLDALPPGTTAATRRRLAEALGRARPAAEW